MYQLKARIFHYELIVITMISFLDKRNRKLKKKNHFHLLWTHISVAIVTNMLPSFLCYGFVHLFGRSVDRWKYADPVAWQCGPPKYRKMVAGQPTHAFSFPRTQGQESLYTDNLCFEKVSHYRLTLLVICMATYMPNFALVRVVITD